MKYQFEIFITRLFQYFRTVDRIGILWYVLVGWVILILSTTFGYTVIDHAYFSRAAENQQKAVIKNPVSRGNIISSEASLHGILGVSTNLGTLAIDPSQVGSMEKLLPFLSDLVYRESCENRHMSECIDNIGIYIRQNLLSDMTVVYDEKKLRELVESYIQSRINTPIDSVLIKENCSESMIEAINKLGDPSLFFVVNNLYVNPTIIANRTSLAQSLAPIV
jgi:cell division protein FtsI/penicillin-binding protein 2